MMALLMTIYTDNSGGSRICEKGGGGRESKFLDAAPENRPKSAKKTKIGRKKGGGGRGRFGPPPPGSATGLDKMETGKNK